MDTQTHESSSSHFRLTNHAAVRIQQRGIPRWYLRLLLEHGKSTHDGHGAVLKSVARSTRARLQRVLTHEQYTQAERYFGVYAVVKDGNSVITAAHRVGRRIH